MRNFPGAQSSRRPACGQTLSQARARAAVAMQDQRFRIAVEHGFDFGEAAVVDRIEVGQQLSVVALRDLGHCLTKCSQLDGVPVRYCVAVFRPHFVMTLPTMSAYSLPLRRPPPACRIRAAQAAPSAGCASPSALLGIGVLATLVFFSVFVGVAMLAGGVLYRLIAHAAASLLARDARVVDGEYRVIGKPALPRA